jgi:hypothetical protein
MDTHRSGLCSFGIASKENELELPSLYWIPKLHKYPFKQVILLSLPNAPRNPFPNYKHVLYQQSKPGFLIIVTLATPGVV